VAFDPEQILMHPLISPRSPARNKRLESGAMAC
jgi:hypothetical protein